MNREELIAAMQATAANTPRPVKVPGWGNIHVRDVTVAEVEEQNDDTADPKNKLRLARAAARVICEADGKRLFDPGDEADVALLAKQPWKLLRLALADADDKATPSGN
jgi:hypothetical protein